MEINESSLYYEIYETTNQSPSLDTSKLALLVEDRPLPHLVPLILQFISIFPSDWPLLFMGSNVSISAITRSASARNYITSGKLLLTNIPSNMSTSNQEMISRFFTTSWVYESLLAPAEWLLVFQTDSIFCANSVSAVEDFLEYHWVGAPWEIEKQWGGNGGLSLRRVSRILEVLKHQDRQYNSQPEDLWLSERMAHLPGSNMANGSVSQQFSGETIYGSPVNVSSGLYIDELDSWRHGFYEPMGYHIGGSGGFLHSGIWGHQSQREHIYKYCPEVKMTLLMDVARYVPGECNAEW